MYWKRDRQGQEQKGRRRQNEQCVRASPRLRVGQRGEAGAEEFFQKTEHASGQREEASVKSRWQGTPSQARGQPRSHPEREPEGDDPDRHAKGSGQAGQWNGRGEGQREQDEEQRVGASAQGVDDVVERDGSAAGDETLANRGEFRREARGGGGWGVFSGEFTTGARRHRESRIFLPTKHTKDTNGKVGI